MRVRAKFYVESKEPVDPAQGGGFSISMRPVVDGSDENKQFFKYTPGGHLMLTTINELAAESIHVGSEYYVDLTRVGS